MLWNILFYPYILLFLNTTAFKFVQMVGMTIKIKFSLVFVWYENWHTRFILVFEKKWRHFQFFLFKFCLNFKINIWICDFYIPNNCAVLSLKIARFLKPNLYNYSGYWNSGFCNSAFSNSGFCIRDFKFGILYSGFWNRDFEFGILNSGFCIRDFKFGILNSGFCIRDFKVGILYSGF